MELIKIINARQVLNNLADREDIGAHLAYWMTKFILKTEGEHEFYVLETRKLFEKYAEQNGGEMMSVPPDKVAEFNNAVEDLNNTDVEDPGIRFNLSEISAELKLSMRQIYALLDFIDEEN